MSYYIRAHNRREFAIEKLGETLYNVAFSGWTKSHAVAIVNTTAYSFDKESFWSSCRTIYRNNTPIGSMSFNWIGHMILDLRTEDQKNVSYVLKSRGFWGGRVEVIDRANECLLLTLHAEFSWFNYNYRIETENRVIIQYPLIELLGILGVGATLIRDREQDSCY